MSQDYYAILNISKSASEKEIKTAFRALAHKHHPDKGGDEKRFKEINQAYQILSDKEKRTQYDRFGSAGNNFGGFGRSTGQGGFSGAQYYSPFGNATAGQHFTMPSLKKVPWIMWIALLPFIVIIIFFGLIFVLGLLIRNMSRHFSR